MSKSRHTKVKIANLCITMVFCFSFEGQGQQVILNESVSDKQNVSFASYFYPPQNYRDLYGDYRSPLLFANGDSATTVEAWEKRRQEILSYWHQMMGKWPPLIKNKKLEYLETVRREDFTQHHVRFYWMPNEKTDGYLLVPDGEGFAPAVISVYYEPETAAGIGGKPFRDFAYQLVKRGYVTLSIGTREASRAGHYSLYYPERDNAMVQPLSMLAYAAANAWNVLALEERVDSTRIGILGHSFGGKWAMFASCLYEKFACAIWSDPGVVFDESYPDANYWEPWYLGYYPPPWRNTGQVEKAKGAYPKLVNSGHNLHELHALMAPRPFLVSGGAVDPPKRWKALNHTIRVNEVLGYYNRVAMTNRETHSPNGPSNEQIYQFLDYFLKK